VRHSPLGTLLPCERFTRSRLARLQPRTCLLRRHRRDAVDRLASHSRLPGKAQARRARADSKPAAKRLERGSNARFVEEVLRARAPQAVRPAEIRAALQRDKGVSLAFTSIRHALGQLEARKAVEQDGNGGWRIAR